MSRSGALGRARGAFDPDGILVDDVLERLGVAAGVADIPAEQLEQGINELDAGLGLVDRAAVIAFGVAVEDLDQVQQFIGYWHRRSLW